MTQFGTRAVDQLFPNDRIIVGRTATVQKTVELDRFAAPIHTVTAAIVQQAFTLRALLFDSLDHPDELLKELVGLWAKQVAQPGDVEFDEKTLREILMRKLKPLPPSATTPAPK